MKDKKLENKPSYYSVVPAEVRYSKKISSTAKLLYAEISSLANKEGYCWANNQYFSKLFNKTKAHISSIISDLKEEKFILVELDKKEGNKRKIYLNKYLGGYREKSLEVSGKIHIGIKKNPYDNIKKNNKSNINNIIDKQEDCLSNGELQKLLKKKWGLKIQNEARRLVRFLEEKLNTKIVNWGKQMKAVGLMDKAGYTEIQIKKTIIYMAEKDDFFADRGFDLMTVANQISRYKAKAGR